MAGTHPLSTNVKVMALDMAEEVMSCSLFQERYACSTIVGANVDVQQHPSSDNVYNIRVCDTLWEIYEQNGPFGEFLILLALEPRLRVVVSASSIIKAISALWHECKIVVHLRVCMKAIRILRSQVTSRSVVRISSKGVVLSACRLCICRALLL